VNILDSVLFVGFLTITSAYVVYFSIMLGLHVIILAEILAIAIMVGIIIRQRAGIILSSIVYIATLVSLVIGSSSISGVLAIHIYAGILLAVNIILALLSIGFIRR